MWVELVLALIVEGYREFMEWWQTRSFFRPAGGRRGPRRGDLLAQELHRNGGEPER